MKERLGKVTEINKTLLWLLSIVSRDMGIVWIIYVLFREPITNGGQLQALFDI